MSRYLNSVYVPHVRLDGGDAFDACHLLGSDSCSMRRSVLSKLKNLDLECTEALTGVQILEAIAHHIEECRIVLVNEDDMTMRGIGASWRRARKRTIIVESNNYFNAVRCHFAFHSRLIHYACRVDSPLRISRFYVCIYSCVFVIAFLVSCTIFAFTGSTLIGSFV